MLQEEREKEGRWEILQYLRRRESNSTEILRSFYPGTGVLGHGTSTIRNPGRLQHHATSIQRYCDDSNVEDDQHLIVWVPPVLACTTNFSWLEIWGRRGLSCEHGMLAICFCIHV